MMIEKLKKVKDKIISKQIKELIKIILDPFFIFYTSIFTLIFFLLLLVISMYFLDNNKNKDYNEYVNNNIKTIKIIENKEKKVFSNSGIIKNQIEKNKQFLDKKQKYEKIISDLKIKIKQKELELDSATNVKYIYNPTEFESDFLLNPGVNNISKIIFGKVFKETKMSFNLEFNKDKTDVRGKFVDNTIKLFGVFEQPENEIISVFVHELGHYYDINYIEKKVLFDLSDNFYDISWKSKSVLLEGSKSDDFVSGYAMTNKYEDFAESFTYYIFFNDDFRLKSNKSDKLEMKYDFFSKYVFRNDEFKKTNFRITEEEIKDYYWDTTKIQFFLPDFLRYII